jgi:hypothetical protein
MFAGMDGCTRHDGLPSVIVDDLYLDRPRHPIGHAKQIRH